jgi:hypothetical protein
MTNINNESNSDVDSFVESIDLFGKLGALLALFGSWWIFTRSIVWFLIIYLLTLVHVYIAFANYPPAEALMLVAVPVGSLLILARIAYKVIRIVYIKYVQ